MLNRFLVISAMTCLALAHDASAGDFCDRTQVGPGGGGTNAVNANTSALACGSGASANGADSVSVGRITQANGASSVAVGDAAVANGNQSIAIGRSGVAGESARKRNRQ